MTPLVFVVAIAITAVVSAVIVRALAGRQLAETRGALAAQLATVEQDNKWLRDEVERHKQTLGSTQELLDKTDTRLREMFQSLAAEALKDNRASFFDLAKTSFEGYHQPIAETLKKVDDRLGKVEHERVAAYSMLREQISAVGFVGGETVARPADAGGARPLGRNAAAACRRNRRHAPALRFR